jgi:hypothetical protein
MAMIVLTKTAMVWTWPLDGIQIITSGIARRGELLTFNAVFETFVVHVLSY